jgi:hypothetical protein
MTMSRSQWIAVGLFLGLVGLGAWLVYDPCYCWIESDEYPIHITSIPDGCRIVEIPEPWRDEKGGNIGMFPMPDQEGITMDRVEFRVDPERKGTLMVARQGSNRSGDVITDKNSTNHYRFRLPELQRGPGGDPGGAEMVTKQQWDQGERLTATEIPAPDPRWLGFCVSGSPCANLDRAFPMTLPYGASEPALSPAQRWIAVPSHSIEHPSGNAILSPDWYWRPTERLEIAIYSASSGRLVRHIRGWGCSYTRLSSSQFHGDSVFSLQLDRSARKLLVCGMGKAD